MKQHTLGNRVKELRFSNGFSQEDLAEESGLSLRTIQRIENGETTPHGNSVKRLALAFNIPANDIIEWRVEEDNNIIVLLNLTQLSFLVLPFLGIIIPLIIWIVKKDKVRSVEKAGKEIINFQITWTLLLLIMYFSWIIIAFLKSGKHMFAFGPVISALAFYGVNVLFIAINTFRSAQRKQPFYKPAFRFIR